MYASTKLGILGSEKSTVRCEPNMSNVVLVIFNSEFDTLQRLYKHKKLFSVLQNVAKRSEESLS